MNLFNINPNILNIAETVESQLKSEFEKIDGITQTNQQRVLAAFINNRVSESHFAATTGYGYDDRGRDNLDRVLAEIFGTDDGLIRHSFASGTHTITVALFGLLRPGDRVLIVTGTPYDTLMPVLGVKNTPGSLKEFGIDIDIVPLDDSGGVDCNAVESHLRRNNYAMVYIQRSRGYTLRPSLSAANCGDIARQAKSIQPNTVVFTDNCYGEFAETAEPTACGVDVMAGSLIKNPGGGIVRCGGYIVGRADLVEQCAFRMTAPGVGREVGASLGMNRELYMGLFNAPHITGEALKAAVFAAALFEHMGYDVSPGPSEPRRDIIQSITLKDPQRLQAFCQGLQSGAPIDSYVTPAPWNMPGYDDKVIMSTGAFTSGASIELSADGPMRPPYAAWLQGALNYHSAKVGIMLAAQAVLDIRL